MSSLAHLPLDPSQNQIRLLHLAPAGNDDEEIYCASHVVSLDSEPSYEALSYVWGDAADTVKVTFNGEAQMVTRNLHLALRHLRFPAEERVLWIDALCINQSDAAERTHQVGRMNRIYSQATSVVVWLGEPWDSLEIALDTIAKLGTDPGLHLDPCLDPSFAINGLSIESKEIITHIARFFTLPWWTRIWTVQEFALARKVTFQCGHKLLEASLLQAAEQNIERHRKSCCLHANLQVTPDGLKMGLLGCWDVYFRLRRAATRKGSDSFLLLLAFFRGHEATDARDKIYGMLGLANAEYADRVEPDYSMPVERTFEIATLATVEMSGSLDCLSHIFMSSRRRLDLPSYVPDWTAQVFNAIVYEVRIDALDYFDACGSLKPEIQALCPGRITTPAISLDAISEVGSVGGVSKEEMLRQMQDISRVNIEPDAVYSFTNEPIGTAFRHTLCGGLEFDHEEMFLRRIRNVPDLSTFEKWQSWMLKTSPDFEKFYDLAVANINDCFSLVITGRRFIRTSHGYIGFGPQGCLPGDIVAIIPGGAVPYVLRRVDTEEGQEAFNILGDCYVHGIMDGEVLRAPNRHKFQQIVLL